MSSTLMKSLQVEASEQSLRALEPARREAVAARLTRGKVDCRITFTQPKR